MAELDEIQMHPGGPYVQALFLCERVLTEGDGTNTYVRVIDKFARQVVGPDRPADMQFRIEFTLVTIVRHGRSTGPVEMKIRGIKPSGEYLPEQTLTLQIGPVGLMNVHIPVALDADQQGKWELQVLLNGMLCGATAFTVEDSYFSGPVSPSG